MSADTKSDKANRLPPVESYQYDVTGRWVTTTSGTNMTWGVHDGAGGSLPSSVIGLRYLFQGREYSWAVHAVTGGTGLYYFRARWYDPSSGRWLSNDPIGISGGLNQYAFCANNPVMFVDPEGRESTTITAKWTVEVPKQIGRYIVPHSIPMSYKITLDNYSVSVNESGNSVLYNPTISGEPPRSAQGMTLLVGYTNWFEHEVKTRWEYIGCNEWRLIVDWKVFHRGRITVGLSIGEVGFDSDSWGVDSMKVPVASGTK